MLKRLLVSAVITAFAMTPATAQNFGDGFRILDQLLNQPRRDPGDRLIGRVPDGRNERSQTNRREERQSKTSEWQKIEARLESLGYAVGSADGRPDENTVQAIARFQEANNLDIDGKIGPQTRAALFSEQAIPLEFADQAAPSNVRETGPVAVPDWAATSDKTVSAETSQAASPNECAAVQGDTAAKICSTGKLLDLKREINRRYAAAVAVGGSSAATVQTAQEQWTALLSSCGADTNCIESALSMRLAMLPKTEAVASGKDLANPAQAAASSGALLARILPHASEPGSIIGQWEGVAQCAEGRSFYMTLAVEKAGGSRFTAEATYVWERYLAGEAAKIILIGEAVSSQAYEFVYQDDKDTDHNVGRYLSKNFSLAFDGSRDMLQGTYPGNECISFALTRTTSESKSRIYLVDQDISGPNYYSLQTLADKCAFFRDYFETPFFELKDKERREVEDSNAGLILLADRYFVPRFGNVVDGLTKQQKQQVLSDYTLCQNDPIWKSRLEPYHNNMGSTVLFWGFQDGLRDYEKPVPPTKADLNFWKMRQARNEVYLAVKQAESEQDTSAVKQRIAVANDRIAHFEALFFPSEVAELKKKLGAADAKSYIAKADAKLEQLATYASERDRIAKIGQLYNHRVNDLDGAPSDAKERYESELTSRQLAALKAELAPAFALAVAGSGSSTSVLEQFEKTVEDVTQTSGVIIPTVKEDMTRLISEKRATLVAEAVEIELQTMKGFDPSLDGVRKSADWVRGVEEGYKRYADEAPVKAMWEAVRANREQLFAGAFPAFETELEKAIAQDGIAGIKAVAAEYLTWSGDNTLSVSRQYLVALANAERKALENTPDGINRIVQSKEIFDKREIYRPVFSSEEFSGFETAVVNTHESAARNVVFRLLDLNSIKSIEDVAKMQQKLEKVSPIFDKMLPESAARLKDEIQAKSDDVVRESIKLEIERLAGFSADQQGVQASATWIRDFDARYEAFKNMAEYGKARDQFLVHREKLLLTAFPGFEKELKAVAAQKDPAAVDQLLRQYLAWEGDEEFTISLEYQLSANLEK